MMEGRYDYWRIHENQPPHIDIQHVPLSFEGQIYPDVQVKVGRYFETGCFTNADSYGNQDNYRRVNAWLIQHGRIKPFELVGYPYYYDDRVEYTRYLPDRNRIYSMIVPCIRAGFQTMVAKKRVGFICRYHNLPEDCEQIIKEFLLPIPRNKAYW
jgi:hypothetical protein